MTPILIQGHHGLGDNLHQRAIVRQLMKDHQVWLESSWVAPYYDLIASGLKVIHRPTVLRTQTKNAGRERQLFSTDKPPINVKVVRLSYNVGLVREARSVLGAMFKSANLKPESMDFRLPVPREWVAKARAVVGHPDKPIMVYRPLVVRREWKNEARNPDHASYAALFKSIRDQFHVISLADVEPNVEWIVGERVEADQSFHRGELDFETLAGLFSIAGAVFCSPGFAVVLAQAVGAPVISVFGGYESAYSFSAGAQFSPWCPIEPITPVDDFSHYCMTSKKIDMPAALDKIAGFVGVQERAVA